MITVKVDGKTIKIMSEIEAQHAENAVDVRKLSEPICGSNIEKAVAADKEDYQKVNAYAAEIANALAQNDSVTVFCKLGQHRSVTSVLLYLTKHGGKDEVEAKQILNTATKTEGHIISWDQVNKSFGYINAFPFRRGYKSDQSATTVSNTNTNVTNNNNVSTSVSSSRSGGSGAASGSSFRYVRQSEVDEITEQKDHWNKMGEESDTFWPNRKQPKG